MQHSTEIQRGTKHLDAFKMKMTIASVFFAVNTQNIYFSLMGNPY